MPDVDDQEPGKILIPRDAIGNSGADAGRLIIDLLRRLNLQPLKGDLAKAGGGGGALAGSPDSVAVIEAGATAASKWWSVAIGASSTGLTATIATLWNKIGERNQPNALLAVGIVIATGTVGIAYILGSDVRGRASAMVATIEARARIASVALREAQQSQMDLSPDSGIVIVGLANIIPARHVGREGIDEEGWRAVSARQNGETIEYLLAKGAESDWVAAKDVRI